MTTTYYTFHTRKVKVSGGADLLTLVPVAQTEGPAVSADGKVLAPKAFGGKLPVTGEGAETSVAQILDFDFCRKHMETQNAWKALAQSAQEAQDPEDGEEFLDTRWAPVEGSEGGALGAQGTSGKWQASDRLELLATAAVILVSVCASLAFLSLL